MATRLFDIAFSLIGLVFLLLMYPIVALLIKLDSRGPVFFKCARVGKDGKIFHMYKFRTMYESDVKGQSVSPQGDPRVTRIGRILRRLKLNEFPQFLNILRGEMTLVGPRPEAPDLAADYPLEARRIFTIKPGLVGPNQILGRNEEEFYPRGVDPKEYYLTKILPGKIPLDLQYIDEKSFLTDLKYLFLGIWVTVTGMVRLQHLWANKQRILLLAADSAFCLISFMLAYFIRYETLTPAFITQAHLQILPFTALTHISFLFLLGCYSGVLNYFGINDIKIIFKALVLGTLTLLLISLNFKFNKMSGSSIFIINFLFLSVFLVGYRIFIATLGHILRKNNGQELKRALIIGAGEEGLLCLHYLQKNQEINYQIMGFIDEDPLLQYKKINGIKVIGGLADLEIVLPLYKIDEVFIADSIKQPEEGIKVQKVCRKHFVALTSFVPNMVVTPPIVYPQKPAPSIY